MKTTKSEVAMADGWRRVSRALTRHGHETKSPGRWGFTLIELLVVISIMAILASFTLMGVGGVKRLQWINTAKAEMTQIQSALDDYKAKYGVYPPSNANSITTYTSPQTNSMYPPLFYELCGVTNKVVNGVNVYQPLDGSVAIPVNSVQTAFGVGAFINCSQGSGEDTTAARNFLMSLKANRLYALTNNGVPNVTILITSVGGPDIRYQPLGAQNVNPFRYVYPGVNNPSGYDLWVNLVINNKTNLICNWSPNPIINSGYP
jgi:prepilin-type N-terminal cleavage/methylation domain-containing protein